MALYEKMNEIDIIEPILELIGSSGGFRIHGDGKIRSLFEPSIFHDGPWLNVKVSPERNCFLWHHIYFKQYGIIHSNCFNCWKVVVKPRTLKELMSLVKIELALMKPSKCGIERRDYNTHGGWYAGFFYAPMTGKLEDAKLLCEEVRELVNERISPDVPVFLKRACTEFENRFGPSNSWVYPKEQEAFEAMLDSTWDVPPLVYPEPTVLVPFMFKKWIGWAISKGDPTAKDYYETLEGFGITPTIKYDQEEVEITSCPTVKRGGNNAPRAESTEEKNETQLYGLPED